MEYADFVSPHDLDLARRRKRIKEKFCAMHQENPTLPFTTVCRLVAESEKDLPDGIKSLSGVKNIALMYQLQYS